MSEPIMTGVSITTAVQAGGFAALIALVGGDINMMMVFITGITGGLAFFVKEYAHLDKVTKANTTKLKIISEFLHMIPMSIATAGIVIYTGIGSINQYIEADDFVWWFFGLMASLNYKHVVGFFTLVIKEFLSKLVTAVVNFIVKRFG